MRTDFMTCQDAQTALEWLSLKIQKAAGNDRLSFPAEWFPDTGLVAIDDNGVLLAVATLYVEKSCPVAVCGWCVSNPHNKPAISKKAIELIMEDMPLYAKGQGARHLLTTFGNRGINRILDSLGFVSGDENVHHKYKIL